VLSVMRISPVYVHGLLCLSWCAYTFFIRLSTKKVDSVL
jgi:hypothetical protein